MSASSMHATQIQNQSTQHISQKPVNFSPISSTSQHSQSSQSFPTPSPQSQTPQFQEQQQPQMQSHQFQEQQPRMQTQQFQDQQSRMQYQDPTQRMQYQDQSRMHYQDPQQRQQQYSQDPSRPQYSPEFVIPTTPRRPNRRHLNSILSSTSVITYSTTQSHQSTQSSSVEYPGPTPIPGVFLPPVQQIDTLRRINLLSLNPVFFSTCFTIRSGSKFDSTDFG